MIGGNANGFGNDYHAEILVHSTEADGSTSFTDSSYNGSTVVVETVTHENTYNHFGPTSIYFGGGTLVYDTYIASTLKIQPLHDDFCIDFWLLIPDDNQRTYTDKLTVGLFKVTGSKPFLPDYNNYCGIRISYSLGDIFFEYISGGTTAFQIGGTYFNYSAGTWYHITANRKNTTELQLFINGVLATNGSIIDSKYTNVRNLDYHVATGHRTAQTTLRNFYIDEWRNSVGHYRWNKDFTVPNRFY